MLGEVLLLKNKSKNPTRKGVNSNIMNKQIASVIAAGSLFINTALPVFAQTTVSISGNGAGSDNWATVSDTNTTTVTQTNTAFVTNTIDVEAETGENSANFNTGGDVAVVTGDAVANIDVSNTLNTNAAQVNCCYTGATDVTVSGNGAFSENGVLLDKTNDISLNQVNTAYVDNYVDAEAETGENDALANTNGDVVIATGHAMVDVDVATVANANHAVVGGAVPAGQSASFRILNNGAGSDNYITALLSKGVTLDQTNYADVYNYVDVEAETGENDASFSTGGDVVIDTGNAEARVDIDNHLNFNHAAVDCGCTWDVLAKIEGNGASLFPLNGSASLLPIIGGTGENLITLALNSNRTIGQANLGLLDNYVGGEEEELEVDTGDNTIFGSTAGSYSDPYIVTGNAKTHVDVDNTGNVNTYGPSVTVPLGGMNYELSLNLHALLAWFGLSM